MATTRHCESTTDFVAISSEVANLESQGFCNFSLEVSRTNPQLNISLASAFYCRIFDIIKQLMRNRYKIIRVFEIQSHTNFFSANQLPASLTRTYFVESIVYYLVTV